ncbi:phosphatidylinositol glycan anchor biosynthesis class U protein [Neocloeon triangulifer]|uniref:phosphatidylinositol glycan anchor biosynthesis class U protein n=1 Tax=Neocloeon triangulifer TaxID=2078957 RepID=UPI00286FA5DB|nr:phosphatidylinositol glycan anchor biosynthesis class U protein [Neocloeon triangulifer]
MSALKIGVIYLSGAFVRFWLMNYSGLRQMIEDRVEISTPINSWKRVTEGVHLMKNDISPYDGDLFHETPLGLFAFSWLLTLKQPFLDLFFIFVDALTCFCLQMVAESYSSQALEKEKENKKKYAEDSHGILLTEDQVKRIPLYVIFCYNFNPYTILSCVGRTTSGFNNFFVALTLLFMCKGWLFLCSAALAVATYQAFYTVVFIVPACMYIVQQKKMQKVWPTVSIMVISFAVFLGSLFYLSMLYTDSWAFLTSTYKFLILVPDLRPNVGLFWYFFTEMFEHFRALFVCAFQINCFLYLAPLALRLRKEPMLLAFSLAALSTVFRSYPSISDLGFYFGMLPIWLHLLPYMQQGFVVCCFILFSSGLGPVVWQLWIYMRSGNANFYFGVTLAFATAQIFLITDILFAHIKREFTLVNGTKRELNGKPAKLVLE